MRFEGRTALITGGSRGIGKAIALQLATESAEVVIVGREQESLNQTVQQLTGTGLKAFGIVGDLTYGSEVERIIDEVVGTFGKIDVLVNNAASSDSAKFLDMTREQWESILHANLTSPFLVSQAAARHMVNAGRGAIINISSVSAHGADLMANYSASKSGLHSLTRDIATELAEFGVRCVTVTPGWVDTGKVTDLNDADFLHTLRTNFKRVPMKRLLSADEVARVVAFAASDDAGGMTGCEIVVDGGALGSVYINGSLS